MVKTYPHHSPQRFLICCRKMNRLREEKRREEKRREEKRREEKRRGDFSKTFHLLPSTSTIIYNCQ
jgi:hypothetical protein